MSTETETTDRPELENKAKVSEKIVILLHGIRTRAVWQEEIAPFLRNKTGAKVFAIKFGRFDLLKFLLPIPDFRNGPIVKVRDEIELILDNFPGAERIVIAHSYGTYCLTKILEKYSHIKFDQIILCGSVVPADYPWNAVLTRGATDQKPREVINEVGTRDFWPVLAKSMSWGYGSTGTFGFGTPANVLDRRHHLSHSGFLTKKFANDFWLPLIQLGKICETSEFKNPKWIEFLKFPWKYLVVLGLCWLIIQPISWGYRAFAEYMKSPVNLVVLWPKVDTATFGEIGTKALSRIIPSYVADIAEKVPQKSNIQVAYDSGQTIPKTKLMLDTVFSCFPANLQNQQSVGTGEEKFENCFIINIKSVLRNSDGTILARHETHLHSLLWIVDKNYIPLAIAQQLGVNLDTGTFSPPSRPLTNNTYALALFLRGMDELTEGANVKNWKKAQGTFEEALKHDDQFAAAMWMLGSTWADEDLTKSKEMQDQALALDPDVKKFQMPDARPDPIPLLVTQSQNKKWKKITGNMDLMELKLDFPDVIVTAVRMRDSQGEFKIVTTEKSNGSLINELVDSSKSEIGINAGYFDLRDEMRIPTGLLKVGGKVLSEASDKGVLSGLIGIANGRIYLEWFKNSDASKYESALQTGPFLIDPGGAIGIYENAPNYLARRSAVCLSELGQVFVYSGNEGLSMLEFARLLSKEYGIFDCERALYLDGGPSSQMVYPAGEHLGGWQIVNAIVWTP